jgi:hypothetical protein
MTLSLKDVVKNKQVTLILDIFSFKKKSEA